MPLRYRRRAPRKPLACAAMASFGSLSYFGTTVDLGPGGAAVQIRARVPNGTAVWVLLDPAGLPAALASIGGVSLPGRVVSTRALGSGRDGHLQYRLGIELHSLVPETKECLGAFFADDLERTLEDVSDPTRRRMLAETPEGRERLFQAALAATETGRLEAARAALDSALGGDPANQQYRTLAARIRIEEMLVAQDVKRASREIARALELYPDDRSLRALRARIADASTKPARRRRGLLGLFR